tara:strand:- start:488 stop:1087 length:600 start_codon:yes stop_codon:yes gene_type:complete
LKTPVINKRILIQLSILLLIFLSIIIFYNKYLKVVKDSTGLIKDKDIENQSLPKNDLNLIYNLNYNSKDIENNQYFINSDSGTMSENNSEFMMNIVNAKIILNDKTEIIIYSDNAIYNNMTYYTKFYGNVVAKYGVNTINSQSLDLNFEENLATIYDDVLFENLDSKIKTDRVEFDLKTKNILVLMNDKSKKVNITSNF